MERRMISLGSTFWARRTEEEARISTRVRIAVSSDARYGPEWTQPTQQAVQSAIPAAQLSDFSQARSRCIRSLLPCGSGDTPHNRGLAEAILRNARCPELR